MDLNSTDCPVGGPIIRIHEGQASIVAQGSPLLKPRGSVLAPGETLIIADGQAGLLKMSLQTGAVTVIAFNPPSSPRDVAIDRDGNYIVVEQPLGSGVGIPAVYKVTPDGRVSIIARGAPLIEPHGLDIDASGNYIVADTAAGIFRVTPQGQVTLVAATNPNPGSILFRPADVRVDKDGNYIVAEIIRAGLLKVTPTGDVSNILRGSPFSRQGGPRGVAIDPNGDYIVAVMLANALFRVTPRGRVTTIFSGPPLCGPADVTVVPVLTGQ